MKIWTSTGNKFQIKIEIEIAEKQYLIERHEKEKSNASNKIRGYERKILDLELVISNCKKPFIAISISEYQEIKSDLFFYKEKRADMQMYVDMIESLVVELIKDIDSLEREKKRLETVVIEFNREQRKAIK